MLQGPVSRESQGQFPDIQVPNESGKVYDSKLYRSACFVWGYYIFFSGVEVGILCWNSQWSIKVCESGTQERE